MLPVASEVEYFYDRGDRGRIGRPASSGERPHSTLTVEDQVQMWPDLNGCK